MLFSKKTTRLSRSHLYPLLSLYVGLRARSLALNDIISIHRDYWMRGKYDYFLIDLTLFYIVIVDAYTWLAGGEKKEETFNEQKNEIKMTHDKPQPLHKHQIYSEDKKKLFEIGFWYQIISEMMDFFSITGVHFRCIFVVFFFLLFGW